MTKIDTQQTAVNLQALNRKERRKIAKMIGVKIVGSTKPYVRKNTRHPSK